MSYEFIWLAGLLVAVGGGAAAFDAETCCPLPRFLLWTLRTFYVTCFGMAVLVVTLVIYGAIK